MIKIPVEVSARHVHLSQKDLELLFGSEYNLSKKNDLTQPSDFAANETVAISNFEFQISNLRVVGPVREQTQVEISKTDAIKLGLNPPIRLSGDINGSSEILLVGPNGEAKIKEGLIIAERHIHCATKEAKEMKLKNGDEVSVKIESERPITFHNVKVRVNDNYKFCLHIDADEGNAAGINKTGEGIII